MLSHLLSKTTSPGFEATFRKWTGTTLCGQLKTAEFAEAASAFAERRAPDFSNI
jgi:hypothetical protein